LVRQFGASARGAIDTEVEKRLAGRSRLEREDLDAIERGILAAVRRQRSRGSDTLGPPEAAPGSLYASASAPTLMAAPATPLPPRISSAVVGQRRRSSGGGDGLEPLASSQPLPVRPKLRAYDHYDLLIDFDTDRKREEETEKTKGGAQKKLTMRSGLDTQILEQEAAKQLLVEERRKDREDVLAKMEAARAAEAAELAAEKAKREVLRKASVQSEEFLDRRKRRMEEYRIRERDEVSQFLESEEKRKSAEEQSVKEAHKRRAQLAREMLEGARAEQAKKKEAAKEADRTIALQMQKKMAETVAAQGLQVTMRQDRVDRIVGSLGTTLVAGIAQKEKEMQDRDERSHNDYARKRVEDYWRELEVHGQKVNNMTMIRAQQIAESGKEAVLEREADKRQAEIWRQQKLEYELEEREKAARARKAREDVDGHVLSVARENLGVHKSEIGFTEENRQREISYNKRELERVEAEGFRKELAGTFLLGATRASTAPGAKYVI